MTTPAWLDLTLQTVNPAECWQQIADYVLERAQAATNPVQLHDDLRPLDRALAEAAWTLWEDFPTHALRTATVLTDWWRSRASLPTGRAVLLLDALSLRELPLLLAIMADHQVTPLTVRATGAEIPTDTDHFAAALGLPGRSRLANDKAPASFVLASNDRYTDVIGAPFADCVGEIPPRQDIVLWHTWPDDLLSTYRIDTDGLRQTIDRGLKEDGFWQLIARLRQHRQVIITSDHGYATTDRFSTEETGAVKDYLAQTFGAMRVAEAKAPLATAFFPPPALTFDRWHVVLGQRWWKIKGGYPRACHGGVSLLEAFSPYIIIPEAM